MLKYHLLDFTSREISFLRSRQYFSYLHCIVYNYKIIMISKPTLILSTRTYFHSFIEPKLIVLLDISSNQPPSLLASSSVFKVKVNL